MATMHNIEDVRERINIVGICTSGNYVHKLITKLYSYQFIVFW
jgi:predicted CoA-binding protein